GSGYVADNEPAQMMRRLRPVPDETPAPAGRAGQRGQGASPRADIPMPEPRVMRPAVPVEQQRETPPPPPSPTAADRSFRDDPLLVNAAREAMAREAMEADHGEVPHHVQGQAYEPVAPTRESVR